MKFRYRFERILRTRKLLEDRGVEELGRLNSERDRHDSAISQLEDQKESAIRAATPTEGSTTTVMVILEYLQELARLQGAIEKEEAAIEKLEQEIEEQRERVRQLYQQRQIFEKVKERDLKEHLREVAHRDQKTMDEHATMRHGRGEDIARVG